MLYVNTENNLHEPLRKADWRLNFQDAPNSFSISLKYIYEYQQNTDYAALTVCASIVSLQDRFATY